MIDIREIQKGDYFYAPRIGSDNRITLFLGKVLRMNDEGIITYLEGDQECLINCTKALPCSLSEDLIKDLGFKPNKLYEDIYNHTEGLILIRCKEGYLCLDERGPQNHLIQLLIHDLHQLQNLFRELLGKELIA